MSSSIGAFPSHGRCLLPDTWAQLQAEAELTFPFAMQVDGRRSRSQGSHVSHAHRCRRPYADPPLTGGVTPRSSLLRKLGAREKRGSSAGNGQVRTSEGQLSRAKI